MRSEKEKRFSYYNSLKGFKRTSWVLFAMTIVLFCLTVALAIVVPKLTPPIEKNSIFLGLGITSIVVALIILITGIIWAVFNIVVLCTAGRARGATSVPMLRTVFLISLILFFGCIAGSIVLSFVPINPNNLSINYYVTTGFSALTFIVVLVDAIFSGVQAKNLA